MDLAGARGPPGARPGPTQGPPGARPGLAGQARPGPARGPPRIRNRWNQTKTDENIENPSGLADPRQVARKSTQNRRKCIKRQTKNVKIVKNIIQTSENHGKSHETNTFYLSEVTDPNFQITFTTDYQGTLLPAKNKNPFLGF